MRRRRATSLFCAVVLALAAAGQAQPILRDDSAATPRNTPVAIDAMANDSGPFVPGSGAFTQPSNGTVTGGTPFLYTPRRDFLGTDKFTYSLTGVGGARLTATVTITVEDAPPPFELQDDFASTPLNTPVAIDAMANDVGTWVLGSGSFTQPSNGAASGGHPFVYSPANGFSGVDTFTYSLKHVSGVVATAIVTITVDPAPLTPEAVDDFATTPRATPVTIDVFANDVGTWVAGSNSAPAHGTAVGMGNGVFEYTPNPAFAGTDGFTYTVIDVSGAELTAAVTITVDSTPLAFDDDAATNVGVALAIPILDNDFGDIVSKTFTQGANGVVTETGDALTYTPNPGFRGVDTFSYTILDAGNLSSTADVRIGVNDVVFTDVTAQSGIDYLQCAQCGASPAAGLLAMTGGAAAADYDRDGDVDVYVTRIDASDILYANNGNGTFSDATAGTGINRVNGSNGAAWADVDADGDLDLYVTSVLDTRYYLYINDGAGHFSEEAVARGASHAGPDTHIGYSVTFGDYDEDGYLDMHTEEWRPDGMNPTGARSNSRLLRNRGSSAPGYFDDVTDTAGVALEGVVGAAAGTFSFASRFADFDNDGLLDLAVVADGGESRLFWNNGDGTFQDGTAAAGTGGDENGMGNAIGDANGDGFLDWLVTSIYDPVGVCAPGTCAIGTTGNRLYLNNGDRTFADVTSAAGVRDGGWGWGATFIDYDNDGDEDIVHTNGIRYAADPITAPWWDDQVRFFENDGTGTFSEKASSVGLFDTASGKGLLKFDYDNDGDQDIFIVNTRERPKLYRNDGGNSNGWLRVAFDVAEQSVSARVVVQVVSGGAEQHREANTGSNFLGQDEESLHFGLGDGTDPVHKVRVTMPSGTVKEYTNVPRNSVLTVND